MLKEFNIASEKARQVAENEKNAAIQAAETKQQGNRKLL